MHIYETNFDLSFDLVAAEEAIEIRNPAGSGKTAAIVRVGVSSEAEFGVFRLTRYTSLATHGTGGDAPAQHVFYKWDPAAEEATVEIYSGTPDTHITWPSAGAIDFTHDFQLFPADAGDDDKVQWSQYMRQEWQVLLAEGTSASLTVPEGQAAYTFKIHIEERPLLPAAHIASAQLPAAGAFTTATYFDLPETWAGITFLVTYTAHASSTNARPKWRLSWSDGTSDFIQPVVSTSLDTSASPVASRNQYQLTDQWPAGITANATVHFAVPFDRMPGMMRVRLDVAELGDTTNRGTAAVTIVGG